jgi:hypothetical protein
MKSGYRDFHLQANKHGEQASVGPVTVKEQSRAEHWDYPKLAHHGGDLQTAIPPGRCIGIYLVQLLQLNFCLVSFY